MSMKFIPGILILAVLFSCSDLSRSDRLSSLDMLNDSLDSMEVVALALEENKINNMFESSERISEKIEELDPDTIEYDFAIRLDRFKQMNAICSEAKLNYEKISALINEERSSVKNLYQDIENDQGQRNKYDEYIGLEKRKIEQLQQHLVGYIDELTLAINTFDELNVILTKEIDELMHPTAVQ